jgi:hypothetical protein
LVALYKADARLFHVLNPPRLTRGDLKIRPDCALKRSSSAVTLVRHVIPSQDGAGSGLNDALARREFQIPSTSWPLRAEVSSSDAHEKKLLRLKL